jgi:hypothetical protein
VRFRNFSGSQILVPYKQWTFPSDPADNHITLSLTIEPDELTDEFDPDDPMVQLMLRAHPELRPVIMRTAWQKVLDEIL